MSFASSVANWELAVWLAVAVCFLRVKQDVLPVTQSVYIMQCYSRGWSRWCRSSTYMYVDAFLVVIDAACVSESHAVISIHTFIHS